MTLRHAPLLLVLLAAVGACAPRRPHAVVGLLEDGVAAFAAQHPLAAGEAMRVDELTVHVLSGGGVLVLARRRVTLRAGDVVLIARGVTHWFTPGGREPAVALAVFTPPLDGPDAVPVDVDSAGDGG